MTKNTVFKLIFFFKKVKYLIVHFLRNLKLSFKCNFYCAFQNSSSNKDSFHEEDPPKQALFVEYRKKNS